MARILIRSDIGIPTVELARADPDDDGEQPWAGRCDGCGWVLTPADRAAHHTADAVAAAEVHVDHHPHGA